MPVSWCGEDTMPDLPTGTVTFLFTDIAGSTALWERDRAAMREAVDRQLALLRTSIQAHVGRGGPYRLKEIAAHH
jgi:class 3 adenylate cyclase